MDPRKVRVLSRLPQSRRCYDVPEVCDKRKGKSKAIEADVEEVLNLR